MVAINNTGYSSIKIFCESKNANQSIAAARKVWGLQNPIVLGNTSNIKMLCSVESCSIPLSYYTVNDTNNCFIFNGNFRRIQAGNYNANSLVLSLNASQTGLTFFFNRDMSKLLIQGKKGTNTIDYVENSIYKMLGIFLVGAQITWQNEIYYVPASPINLVYTSGIYVSLNNISNGNLEAGMEQQSSTCLIRIPICQPVNTYLQHFNAVGFKNLLSGSVLNQLDISLLDDNRNLLQLSENSDWVVVLRIDFERTITEFEETTKINKMR
jgi:hypothetical protein